MDDATNEHYSMFFVEQEGTAWMNAHILCGFTWGNFIARAIHPCVRAC